jgi:hypothetical protein
MGSSLRLSELRLQASGVELPNGLALDSLVMQSGPAAYEEGSVSLASPAELVATVGPKAIERLLGPRLPGAVRDLRVECGDGEIGVLATAQVVVPVQVSLRLRLEVEDRARVVAVLEEVQPGLARGLIEEELRKANPVLDASDLPVEAAIESVEVRPGVIELRASVAGYRA